MKKAISIFLCMIFLVQFCSCSDNKISDSADETTSQVVEFTEIEKKFNNLEPKTDYFLAVSSETDLTDMFYTAFLEKSYEFEVNKQTAENILKVKVGEITKDKATNTEKAKACYDWIIKNVEYHEYGFGNWLSLIVVLNDKQGNPFDFAYTYYSMLKYIGVDAKFVTGFRSLETGGSSKHAWVTVEIDGVTYYFDPFTDNNNAEIQNAETCYDCFLKTDEEVGYRYIEGEIK